MIKKRGYYTWNIINIQELKEGSLYGVEGALRGAKL